MPKKGSGENSKAVEARAKKESAKKAEKEQKQKAIEDELWKDELPKNLANKQQRKEEKEKKRVEKLDRKTTNKMLAEEELETVAAQVSNKQPPAKITRAEIEAEKERREAAIKKLANSGPGQPSKSTPKPIPIEENLNRFLNVDEEATTVDEALRMLTMEDSVSVDKHPERRARVAFNSFASKRLPQLKSENPSLKLSQLKNLLWTEWQKSSENPLIR